MIFNKSNLRKTHSVDFELCIVVNHLFGLEDIVALCGDVFKMGIKGVVADVRHSVVLGSHLKHFLKNI